MDVKFSATDWRRRQNEAIAQGALTNSKRPASFVDGVYPTQLVGGDRCFVDDVSKRRFVDFICGLGTNLLGYGNTDITREVTKWAQRGPSLSLSSTLEAEYAEKLKGRITFVDRFKFLKTGSEACSAAIKIARAFTGRKYILSQGYHAWHDEFVSLTPPAFGVCGSGYIKTLTDFNEITEDVAAVIVEPIITEDSKKQREWLGKLREKCTETGTKLIFDEIITGFRVPNLTIAQYYGVTPDLICLGKAMANGFPLSAVGGKSDIMDNPDYFVSSTYAGDVCSLAAASKVLDLLYTKHPIEVLWSEGRQFLEKFNEIAGGIVSIVGYPTRGSFIGDPLSVALFWQEAIKARLLFGASWFINFHHIETFPMVLNACEDIFSRIKYGHVKLEGEMPKKPFAQSVREK